MRCGNVAHESMMTSDLTLKEVASSAGLFLTNHLGQLDPGGAPILDWHTAHRACRFWSQ